MGLRRDDEDEGNVESTSMLIPHEDKSSAATRADGNDDDAAAFAHGVALDTDLPFNYEECLSKVSSPVATVRLTVSTTVASWLTLVLMRPFLYISPTAHACYHHH